jgi:hypothetical protein
MDARRVRDRDGTLRPKSLKRWRRLTLLAQGTMPRIMLLEDAENVCDILQATSRTVRAATWADELIALAQAEQVEGLF